MLATPLAAPALLILGALLAGCGPRAEISAAFYVCIYAGVAGPVIGIGILAAAVSLYTAVSAFAAVTGIVALGVAVWHLRHREADEGVAATAG